MFWHRWFAKRAAALTPELQARIRDSFDAASADDEHFPATIDPRIYHVQLLLETFGDLNDRRVLDAGCGKGRFARVLLERNARAEIWGLDISEKMLAHVPKAFTRARVSSRRFPSPTIISMPSTQRSRSNMR